MKIKRIILEKMKKGSLVIYFNYIIDIKKRKNYKSKITKDAYNISIHNKRRNNCYYNDYYEIVIIMIIFNKLIIVKLH